MPALLLIPLDLNLVQVLHAVRSVLDYAFLLEVDKIFILIFDGDDPLTLRLAFSAIHSASGGIRDECLPSLFLMFLLQFLEVLEVTLHLLPDFLIVFIIYWHFAREYRLPLVFEPGRIAWQAVGSDGRALATLRHS